MMMAVINTLLFTGVLLPANYLFVSRVALYVTFFLAGGGVLKGGSCFPVHFSTNYKPETAGSAAVSFNILGLKKSLRTI